MLEKLGEQPNIAVINILTTLRYYNEDFNTNKTYP